MHFFLELYTNINCEHLSCINVVHITNTFFQIEYAFASVLAYKFYPHLTDDNVKKMF